MNLTFHVNVVKCAIHAFVIYCYSYSLEIQISLDALRHEHDYASANLHIDYLLLSPST